MRRRLAGLVAGLLLLPVSATAHADKLPTDEGLKVTLVPNISKMKVGKTVNFEVRFTDDDAHTSVASLEVESGYGTGMASDGVCDSPLHRQTHSGSVTVPAKFKKPGKYKVTAIVETDACHGAVTASGHEEVTVTRTITVTR